MSENCGAGPTRAVGRAIALIARIPAHCVVASCVLASCVLASCGGSSGGNASRAKAPTTSPAVQSSSTASGASGFTGAKHGLLFVGTSLTAGLGLDPDSAYPMLIQRKIDSAGLPFAVTNAGVSGETTSGLMNRLDWLLRGTFDVVVLETGANDGLRGIPPASVEANIVTVIHRIRAAKPETRIVLVQMEALPNLGPRYAAQFHAVYPTIARRDSVTLLPFLLANVAGKPELNQGDGIHPNYLGEPMVAENVWRGLEPILRQETSRLTAQ